MAKAKFQYNDGFGKQHTQSPSTSGTSVLGIVFDKGVVLAADMLASYGSMARFRNVQRLNKINDKTVLGSSGDFADYQYLMQHIQMKTIDESAYEDGHQISPSALHSWVTRVQYNKRSKFDPLWCTWVIGGVEDDGTPYLGYVDKLGTAYKNPIIVTGFGSYLATPIMREAYDAKSGKFTEQEAIQLITKCLQVLYYRDARSWNQYSLAIVNETGSRIEGPLKLVSNWEIAHSVAGYE